VTTEEEPRKGRSTRCRQNDGAGKSASSFRKHELIEHLATAQCAVLSRQNGRGLIVDMHAGDGEGVASNQLSLFGDNQSRATARIAGLLALRHSALCILCEKDGKKRQSLELLSKQVPECLLFDDNERVIETVKHGMFGWALVLNDPCGPSDHQANVLWHLSKCVRRSDFIVVVNEGAIRRNLGLKPDVGQDTGKNAAAVRGARAKAPEYRWMLDYGQWASMLNKKTALVARQLSGHKGFTGRVTMFTNYSARFDRRLFDERYYGEGKQCA
jgi:hypothetical protein